MKLDPRTLSSEVDGHAERMKGPLWAADSPTTPSDEIIRRHALFALEELQNQLDRVLIPQGVTKARIHSLLNRHHEQLMTALVGQVRWALNAEQPKPTLQLGEKELAKLREMIEEGFPFHISLKLASGNLVTVGIIVDVDGLVVEFEPGWEWRTESEEAEDLVSALPVRNPRLSGARVVDITAAGSEDE